MNEIRFITPSYDELFRVPDGSQIRITRSDGTSTVDTCHYIDDYHMRLKRGGVFHICEFAERCEYAGCTVEPVHEEKET